MPSAFLFAGPPSLWFPIFFPAFFLSIWFLVAFIISRVGGWSALADYYRSQQPFMGTMFRFQGAQFRFGTNYNGCLNFGAGAEGLYLVPFVFFRAFHPPLMIPWNEIGARPVKLWFFFSFVELRAQKVPFVPIRIPKSLAEKLAGASAGRLSYNAAIAIAKF